MMTAPPTATNNAGDAITAGGGGAGSIAMNNNYARKPAGTHPAKTPSFAVTARTPATKMSPKTGTVNGEGVAADVAQQLINGLAKTKNHAGKDSQTHQQILSQKRSNTSADNLSPLLLSESENEDDPEPISSINNANGPDASSNTAACKLNGVSVVNNGTSNKENKANGINGTSANGDDDMEVDYLDEMLPELRAAAAAADARSAKKKTDEITKDVSSESKAVAEIAEQKPIEEVTIKDEIKIEDTKTDITESIIPHVSDVVEGNAKIESLAMDQAKPDEAKKNSVMSVGVGLMMESSEETVMKSKKNTTKVDDDLLIVEKILLEEEDTKPVTNLNVPATDPSDDIFLSDVEYLLDDEAEVLLSEKKIREETKKKKNLLAQEIDDNIVMKLEEDEYTIKELNVKDVANVDVTNNSIATGSNENISPNEPSIGVKGGDLIMNDDVLEIISLQSTDESAQVLVEEKTRVVDTRLRSDEEITDKLKDNKTEKMDVCSHVIEENCDVNNISDKIEAVAVEGKHQTAASRETTPPAQNGSRPKRSSDVALHEGNSKKQRLVEAKRKSSVGGATVASDTSGADIRRQPSPTVGQLTDYRSDGEETVIFDNESKSNKSSDATKEPEAKDETSAKKKSDGSKECLILETFSKLHDALKGMTRKQLEQFISAKLMDAIDASSELAKSKERVQRLTDKVQKLEACLAQTRKHASDMDYIEKKTNSMIDKNSSKSPLVTPLYITRSVGLQVSMNIAPASSHHSSKNSSRSSLTRSHSLPRAQHQQQQQQRKSSPQQQHAQNATQTNRSSSGPTSAMRQQQQQQQQSSPQAQQMQPQPVNIIRNLNAAPLEILNPDTRSVTIDLTDEEDRPNGAGGYGAMMKQQQPQPIFVVPQQNVILSNGGAGTNGGRSNTTAYVIGTLPTTGDANKGVITGPSVGNRLMYTTTGGQQTRQTTSAAQSGQRRSGGGISPSQRATTCHPAPLPRPDQGTAVLPHGRVPVVPSRFYPSKPMVTISQVPQGIVISWTMPDETNDHAEVASYQIYAYQESDVPPTSDLWRKVGDVKAMPLPMACTLTQFSLGNRYHFAVRAVDVNSRIGLFSVPSNILLGPDS